MAGSLELMGNIMLTLRRFVSTVMFITIKDRVFIKYIYNSLERTFF